ncbi:MAG: hypothetical protein BroJett042_16280 [Bacteroidota bacterium]|nr:MAG: hypothetical protein BroJett042_16280 [Bacteroidota bacterium]
MQLQPDILDTINIRVMEKMILKGKKEIRLLLIDSLHQTVQALGIVRSRKKTDRIIEKSAKRLADEVATMMKKELKKIKKAKGKKEKKIKSEPASV